MIRSLKNKINLLVVTVIFMTGSLAAFYVADYTKKALIEQKKEELMSAVIKSADEISDLFDASGRMVQSMANNYQIVSYLAGAKALQEGQMLDLLKAVNSGAAYASLYLMDPAGEVLVSTDERFLGNNYGFRRYFIDASAGRLGVEMAVGSVTKEPGYFFASGVVDEEGRLLGILAAKLNQKEISNKIMDSTMSMSGHKHMLLDHNGVIIETNAAERRFMSLGKLNQAALAEIASDNRFGGNEIEPLQYDMAQQEIDSIMTAKVYDFYDEEDGEEELLAIAPIHGYRFFLAMELSKAEFLKAVIRIYTALGFFIILISILATAVVYAVTSHFLRPLDELKAAAARIASNDFSRPVRIRGGGELEDLSRAVNTMMAEVKNNFDLIDRKVKEQTREISRKNKELEAKERDNLQKIRELESWQRTTVDRELKMAELKKDIEELRNRLGGGA